MRLRKPCEHVDSVHPDGHYEPHEFGFDQHGYWGAEKCPGGEFLPEDRIERAFAIIESLTDPRYVIFSEWQQGGAGYFDDVDADRTPLAAEPVGEQGT